jgi:hypothetical protein
MSTWLGCIVETRQRADFWSIASKCSIRSSTIEIPDYILIDCAAAVDESGPMRLAQALSVELNAQAIAFAVQTSVDVHLTRAYRNGECIRCLDYNRDSGGWQCVEGAPQAWEPAYCFLVDGHLDDDISSADLSRYVAAKAANDPSTVLDLVHPSSTAPMEAVCRFFGLDLSEPAVATLSVERPSLWARLFR